MGPGAELRPHQIWIWKVIVQVSGPSRKERPCVPAQDPVGFPFTFVE